MKLQCSVESDRSKQSISRWIQHVRGNEVCADDNSRKMLSHQPTRLSRLERL